MELREGEVGGGSSHDLHPGILCAYAGPAHGPSGKPCAPSEDIQLRHLQPALAIGYRADGPWATGCEGQERETVTLSKNGGCC